ncbi:MAG TPA: NAD(P)-dependent oxidoreductase [Gemmatimonadaceae bacterium]|jgi:nucleoside-diphosphate-sugar epimerase|nr:NAD(P)-dependent oxidoreductase [Gemmatimonadaceae bacterium]
MRILVTGGAGYVGSTLVPHLLSDGHRVRVLDTLEHGGQSLLGAWAHPGFEFVQGDVRESEVVRDALANVDAVVHLAAIVGDPACARQPELARAVNLDASLALLEASRRAGVGRFVFASTCSNYGKMRGDTDYVNECSALAPVSLYAECKVAVERAMLEGEHNGMVVTPLRFATVYGVSPRMRFDLTVNEFTAAMVREDRLVVFGERFWRPYVHVRDVARAVAAVLAAPVEVVASEVFNVGSTGENYQKQQLVELIRPHAPTATVEFVHRAEDPRDYRVSFAKIERTLRFYTTRTVRDGIQEIAHLVRAGIIEDVHDVRYRN